MTMAMRHTQSAIVRTFIIIAMLSAAALAPGSSAASGKILQDKRDKLIGNWSGESVCVGYRPACHDEKVIYRISKSEKASDIVTIQGDKIIGGKPETMYVLDFVYDSQQETLTNEFTVGHTHGIWAFTVKGRTMEGTLTILPDKTIGRRVKVMKDE